MRPQFSLAQVFQVVTLLCVSLGMSAAMGTAGTLIVAALIYIGTPIYAFATKRFREAFRMYVVWNVLCGLVVLVCIAIGFFSQWLPALEEDLDYLFGFVIWTALASGPIGLISAVVIVEFDVHDIGVVLVFFFCLGTISMWVLIWRIFVMRHRRAILRGVKAEAINYLSFLLLVPAFAIFDYFAWFVLATSY